MRSTISVCGVLPQSMIRVLKLPLFAESRNNGASALKPKRAELGAQIAVNKLCGDLTIRRRILESMAGTATEEQHIRMHRMPVDEKVVILGQGVDAWLHLAGLFVYVDEIVANAT